MKADTNNESTQKSAPIIGRIEWPHETQEETIAVDEHTGALVPMVADTEGK